MTTIQFCRPEIPRALFLMLKREMLLGNFFNTLDKKATIKVMRSKVKKLRRAKRLNRCHDSRLCSQSKESEYNLLTA